MKKVFLVVVLFLLMISPCFSWAQSTSEMEAVVTRMMGESEFEAIGVDGNTYSVLITDTRSNGYDFNLQVGQRVYLEIIDFADGTTQVFFGDVIRTNGIFWVFVIFAFLSIVIGRRYGAFSLLGLAVTIGILFGWVFPKIAAGSDPVLTVSLASMVILLVNMMISHGFRRETLVSYLSTLFGLFFAIIFSEIFVWMTHLTGLATEDALTFFINNSEVIVPKGILFAGIILGAVGVLDDIAITQEEIVAEIHQANPNLSKKELFSGGMRVGRHHIASVVNTLVLAYVAASLPLFLIFMSSTIIGPLRFINEEFVAEEIIRTLAGTSALVLTVPIATLFAVLYKKR